MKRLFEAQAGDEAVDPADLGVEHLETVEFQEQDLTYAWTFNELDLATLRREVGDAHPVALLTKTAKRYLGAQRNSRADPGPLFLLGRFLRLEDQPRMPVLPPADVTIDRASASDGQ